MPEISRFYGIVIRMYYAEHGVPHFHAQYAEETASVAISPVTVIEGNLSRRVLSMVAEWAALHAEELSENWLCARRHEPLSPIDPLD